MIMYLSRAILLIIVSCEYTTPLFSNGVLDFNIFRCMWKRDYSCPHEDIVFRMYTLKTPKGVVINVKHPITFSVAGFNPDHETAIIVHGFNGTESNTHIRYLRDAYVFRKFNVITVDWFHLTRYPCYLPALSNTKLVAQCTAQVYAHLTYHGQAIDKITCVGHSLGAHICGMMQNHLTGRQHKIIGLDPARPLIENHKSRSYRLTSDDAEIVQIIHTNAGGLGQLSQSGTVDFCINGGKIQPFCKGHKIRKARCSHFLSVCYLANAIFKRKRFLGVPCPKGCLNIASKDRLPVYTKNKNVISSLLKYMHIGQDTPETQHGTYCVKVDFAKHCPFNDA